MILMARATVTTTKMITAMARIQPIAAGMNDASSKGVLLVVDGSDDGGRAVDRAHGDRGSLRDGDRRSGARGPGVAVGELRLAGDLRDLGQRDAAQIDESVHVGLRRVFAAPEALEQRRSEEEDERC